MENKIYIYLRTGQKWILISEDAGYATLRLFQKRSVVKKFQIGHFRNQFQLEGTRDWRLDVANYNAGQHLI